MEFPRFHCARIRCAAIAMLAACAALLHAATAHARAVPPPQASRVLHTFDFEERSLGNVEDLPMNWVKVEGPGLPHYVTARLANDRHRSGGYSFRFTIDGGSLLYRYPHGRISVVPQAHYRVEVWCQTTVMASARARLTAYCTDIDGHPIPVTLRQSELYSARVEGESWSLLGVDVTADSPDAAWLVVELGLLQPALYQSSSLGSHALFNQEIHGTAWFDDLTVAEVPTVTLHTERPGNIFRHSDALRLVADISDRFTDDLSANLTVRDAQGRGIYQYNGALDLASAQAISARRKRLVMSLPADLPAGWYQAQLQMSTRGQPLGGEHINLIVLADDGSWSLPDSRFGINAAQLAPDGWAQLPDVLNFTGVGRVKIAVWTAARDASRSNNTEFDNLLERLRQADIAPDAALLGLPPDIAAAAGGSDFRDLLRINRSAWQPQLAFLVARHAGYFEDWQIGDDADASIVREPRARQAYDRIRTEFASLVEQPEPSVAWPASFELDSHPPAALALYISPDVAPAQIPLYVRDFEQHSATIAAPTDAAAQLANAAADASGATPIAKPEPIIPKSHPFTLYLSPLDAHKYGREAQLSDFARRIAYALVAGVQRINVPLPYDPPPEKPATTATPDDDPDGVASDPALSQSLVRPQELFLVLRTITTTLSRANYAGKVPIAPGVEAFLFERQGQGILMLWSVGEIADGVPRKLALQLGENPTRLDLWGNSVPLFASTDDRIGGTVTVELGPTPIFLLNVDPRVAELRASLALDNPRIESTFEPHKRHLRFTNTFPQALSGNLRLRPPQGWVVTPSFITFSLNPGQTLDRELTIEFPFNSVGGPKTISSTFRLDLLHELVFTVPLTMDLGLSDVGVQTVVRRDGPDVFVQQFITNYGQTPLDYSAFAICPGRARQERLVVGVEPGATVIKRYRFAALPPESGLKIRTGLKENAGTRVLNEETPVP